MENVGGVGVGGVVWGGGEEREEKNVLIKMGREFIQKYKRIFFD